MRLIPSGWVFGEGPDVVGGGVAEAVAEDPRAAGLCVAPDSECGFEVLEVDLVADVEQRVDQREPCGVGFGARGRGAVHPGPLGG